ncbi:MAG TPA: RHS repeat protein, partial [Thermoanaerobaculaceae bacterium]|nr:RHS repeat protein [Thermoanaerobaculaceae bacterium]HRS17762.1 RHS repeat protein [Thermoanaerobaculaceae bacterium]
MGGDSPGQELDTTEPVCTMELREAPQYRIDHTYAHGALATSRYNGQSWYLVDNDIDQRTGLVATAHASSTRVGSAYDPGITTSFTYDAMGRLQTLSPGSGHDACVLYEYFRFNPVARPDDPSAHVESCSFPNQACGTQCQSSTGVRSSVRYDGLGRPVIEKTRLPANSCVGSNCWNQRLTEYNAMGWKTRVSERQLDETSGDDIRWTTFTYDPFGRVTEVVPPDGTAHKVVTTYTGAWKIARTVKVFTGAAETDATTTETYDRLGQLIAVTEPSNAGTDFTTSYAYDIGGRLAQVSSTLPAGTQTRSFAYDNRGFLTQETLPEKGTSGNGTVSYPSYDARGHLLKKNDGGTLSFAYDSAERLVAVCNGDVTCTTSSPAVLKALTYAATNQAVSGQPTNWRAGKLETATAFNRAFT